MRNFGCFGNAKNQQKQKLEIGFFIVQLWVNIQGIFNVCETSAHIVATLISLPREVYI